MKCSNRGLAAMISSGRSRIGGFWKNEEDEIRLVGTLTGAADLARARVRRFGFSAKLTRESRQFTRTICVGFYKITFRFREV